MNHDQFNYLMNDPHVLTSLNRYDIIRTTGNNNFLEVTNVKSLQHSTGMQRLAITDLVSDGY